MISMACGKTHEEDQLEMRPDVYLSFGPDATNQETAAMKRALEQRGLGVFTCDMYQQPARTPVQQQQQQPQLHLNKEPASSSEGTTALANFRARLAKCHRALRACRAVVVLGTKSYGRRTTTALCSHDELRFVLQARKPVFLVQMCRCFKYVRTRNLLPLAASDVFFWLPYLQPSRPTDPTPPFQIIDEIIVMLKKRTRSSPRHLGQREGRKGTEEEEEDKKRTGMEEEGQQQLLLRSPRQSRPQHVQEVSPRKQQQQRRQRQHGASYSQDSPSRPSVASVDCSDVPEGGKTTVGTTRARSRAASSNEEGMATGDTGIVGCHNSTLNSSKISSGKHNADNNGNHNTIKATYGHTGTGFGKTNARDHATTPNPAFSCRPSRRRASTSSHIKPFARSSRPCRRSRCQTLTGTPWEMDKAKLRQRVEEQDGVRFLLDLMQANEYEAWLQRTACEVVEELVHDSTWLREELVASGVIEALVAAMCTHARDARVQLAGCSALGALACWRTACVPRIVNVGGAHAAVHALQLYGISDTALYGVACTCLEMISIRLIAVAGGNGKPSPRPRGASTKSVGSVGTASRSGGDSACEVVGEHGHKAALRASLARLREQIGAHTRPQPGARQTGSHRSSAEITTATAAATAGARGHECSTKSHGHSHSHKPVLSLPADGDVRLWALAAMRAVLVGMQAHEDKLGVQTAGMGALVKLIGVARAMESSQFRRQADAHGSTERRSMATKTNKGTSTADAVGGNVDSGVLAEVLTEVSCDGSRHHSSSAPQHYERQEACALAGEEVDADSSCSSDHGNDDEEVDAMAGFHPVAALVLPNETEQDTPAAVHKAEDDPFDPLPTTALGAAATQAVERFPSNPALMRLVRRLLSATE